MLNVGVSAADEWNEGCIQALDIRPAHRNDKNPFTRKLTAREQRDCYL